MNAPIPPNTIPNIAGAIGDVFRAGAAWGADSAKGEPSDAAYALGLQFMVQALALVLQRMPNEAEMELMFGSSEGK